MDRLASIVRSAGGRITSGPQPYPDVSPTYYAVYFEDPSGNRLEIAHRTN